jgi:hypothetical protein
MEEERPPAELLPGQGTSPETRRELVAQFVKDISEGRIALSIDQEKWRPEDIELIGSTANRLIVHLNDYLSGTTAGEEFEFLERQLLFCVTVLRAYGAFKTKLNEPKVQEEMKVLESKVDSLAAQLGELLAILRETEAKKTARKTGGRRKKKQQQQQQPALHREEQK